MRVVDTQVWSEMDRVYLDNNFLIKLRDSVVFREQFVRLFPNNKFRTYTSFDTLIEQVSDSYNQSSINLDKMINVLIILNIKILPGWYFVSLNNIYYSCLETDKFEHLVIEPTVLPINELHKSIVALAKQHSNDAIKWKNHKENYCVVDDDDLIFKRDILILKMIMKAKDNNIHKYIPNFDMNILMQSYNEGMGNAKCFRSITSFMLDRSHFLKRKSNITKNDVRDIQQTCFYHYMDVLCLEKNHISRLKEIKIFEGKFYRIQDDEIIQL